MRRPRVGLRARLLAVGLLSVLLAMVIAQSALAGLSQVHESYRAVGLISRAQRAHQDADMMHDALRADVYDALLVGRNVRTGRVVDDVQGHVDLHLRQMRADLRRIDRLPLTGRMERALEQVRLQLENYTDDSARLIALSLSDPATAEGQLVAFDDSFDELALRQEKVTDLLAREAERTKTSAERSDASAARRILLASLLAMVGLGLLTAMLYRMGKNLARLMAEQRGVAETLQQSLLPDRLPELPGMTFAARYLPGASGVEVGGDWYDTIELPTGEVGLVMGDVVGHDLRAASVMGHIRNALRAYALEGLSPADAMGRLNRFVRQIDRDEMATCLFAVYHPEASTLLLANAGHYPPVLVGPDGEAVFLEHSTAPPVGAVDDATYTERLYHLQPGTTVLLYTDGLIERRGEPIQVGLERLRRAVTAAPKPVEELCESVLATLFADSSPTDDVAVLALGAQPVLGNRLELTLPAELTQLASLRRTIDRWLTEAQATPEETFELTVATCEAATNAIEHAYGPEQATFEVLASVTGRDVEISVHDRGQWRPRRGADRGRGLDVIKAFTHSTSVETTDTGTTVRMSRRLDEVASFEMWQGLA
jgi:serine phosphatase RsbU (regulator of sigma subunit)/anti-sigma regulatory factor (Ser/Thr protein kinase)